MLTETVTFICGFLIDGKRYRTAIVREPMVRDSLDAEEKAAGKGTLILSMHVLANMIEKIGTANDKGELIESVGKDTITADAVGSLTDVDFERLDQVRDYLKKKALWQREA